MTDQETDRSDGAELEDWLERAADAQCEWNSFAVGGLGRQQCTLLAAPPGQYPWARRYCRYHGGLLRAWQDLTKTALKGKS